MVSHVFSMVFHGFLPVFHGFSTAFPRGFRRRLRRHGLCIAVAEAVDLLVDARGDLRGQQHLAGGEFGCFIMDLQRDCSGDSMVTS